MIDIRLIRERREEVEQRLRTRDPAIHLDEVVRLEARRRDLLAEVERRRSRRNELGREIGRRKQAGEDAAELLRESQQLKEQLPALEDELREVEQRLQAELAVLPNLPHPSVPVSLDKADNVLVREWGARREFDFEPLNHLELAKHHRLLDLERGAKLAGSQWPLYVGLGARLELALIHFFLETHTAKGYTLVLPPLFVNRETMFTAGNLPKFEDQLYACRDDELLAIPTAEVPLTGLHRDEIIPEDDLPLYYTAYTPCFRREAGTYGAEERGLVRVHQFNKVEMYKFVTPESSYDELEAMVRDAEEVVQKLGLHYRTMLLVTGDLGQQAAKTYDVEVWLPGQNAYYEVSSCSNCEDYQARRGQIRYRRRADRKVDFVHTLNGSGLATSRLLISLLENNQQADGSIVIPEVLRPYLGGLEKIG